MAISAPAFIASAFRYSDDPSAMRRFLETLGLGLVVSHDDDWFELRGRSGAVCLHGSGARSESNRPGGHTEIVMMTPDARQAATYLESQGITATVWDEAYGRHTSIDHPIGKAILINEEMSDFYGYQRHQPSPGPVDVVSVYFTDDLGTAAEFLGQFGFAPDADGGEDWQELRNGERGVIGLHRAGPAGAAGTIGVGFETAEDLNVVADRLQSAGYSPSMTFDPVHLEVTDPDGQPVEIYPSPIRF